jgi:hypothetical protein
LLSAIRRTWFPSPPVHWMVLAAAAWMILPPVCRPQGQAAGSSKPRLQESFRLMYELKFDAARVQISSYRLESPEDPLGEAAEAASFLFEQFNVKGVLTSAFFLDDDRLQNGIEGAADPRLSSAFLEANQKARTGAERILKTRPDDLDALLTLCLTDGMQGDFEALVAKHQLAGLRLIRRAERGADKLLRIDPGAGDAFVAVGAANYIIGTLPAYKRFLLWFGNIRGDKARGLEQLEVAANRGHYLRPLAKVMLALASERERRYDRARTLFGELTREFPGNPLFARELDLLKSRR